LIVVGGMQHVVCVPRAKVPIVRLFDPELYVSFILLDALTDIFVIIDKFRATSMLITL
jgi:DNA polymerase sigma